MTLDLINVRLLKFDERLLVARVVDALLVLVTTCLLMLVHLYLEGALELGGCLFDLVGAKELLEGLGFVPEQAEAMACAELNDALLVGKATAGLDGCGLHQHVSS